MSGRIFLSRRPRDQEMGRGNSLESIYEHHQPAIRLYARSMRRNNTFSVFLFARGPKRVISTGDEHGPAFIRLSCSNPQYRSLTDYKARGNVRLTPSFFNPSSPRYTYIGKSVYSLAKDTIAESKPGGWGRGE